MHQQEAKKEENSIPTITGKKLTKSPSENQKTQVPAHASPPKETKEQESSKDSTKRRVVSIFDTPEQHDRNSPEIDANSPNEDEVNGLQSHFLDVKGSPVQDSWMLNNIISFLIVHGISTVNSFGKVLADDDNFTENLKSLFSYRFLGICSPIHETGQSFFVLKLGYRCYYSDSLSKESWNHLKIDLDLPDCSLIYCESSVDIKESNACNSGGQILKRSDFEITPALYVIDCLVLRGKNLSSLGLGLVDRNREMCRHLQGYKHRTKGISLRCHILFRPITHERQTSLSDLGLQSFELEGFGIQKLKCLERDKSGRRTFAIWYGVNLLPMVQG